MRRVFFATICMASVVAGCAPTSYSGFAKTGVSSETATRDTTECSVEANRLFPAATFTSTVYGGYSTGYGGYIGGAWGGYPGVAGGSRVQIRDANAGLRAEHRRDCMSLKGYAPVTHPVCTNEQLAGRSYQQIAGAPAAAPNICAVRTPNDLVALIDLSKPI